MPFILSESKEWKKAVQKFRFDTSREDIVNYFTGLKDLGGCQVSIFNTFYTRGLERSYEQNFNSPEEALSAFNKTRNFYKDYYPGIRILIHIFDTKNFYLLSEQFEELDSAMDRLSESHRIKILSAIENSSYFQEHSHSYVQDLGIDLDYETARRSIKYEIRVLDSSIFKK